MKKTFGSISAFFIVALLAIAGSEPTAAQAERANPGDITFVGDTLALPLVPRQIHPLVTLTIGGSDYRFVVDTGASVNVIDSDIAARMKYAVVGKTEIGAPGGPKISGNIISIPNLRVEGATIEGAEFVTMDLDKFSGGLMQGVLGLRLFRNYLLTFNSQAGEIELSRDSLSDDDADVVPYDNVSSHIQINVDVAGEIIATHVDTGSMAGFTLPVEMMQTLSLNETKKSGGNARLVGGTRKIRSAQLNGTVRFAGLGYDNPNVGFMDPSPGYGNVGSRVLGKLVVSVDQKNHLIAFRKPDTDNVSNSGQQRRRLGVGFRGVPGGSTLTVASVAADSIAEKAGLAVGDVLSSLNGKPASDYDMAMLGVLFGSSTPLVFGIERDGEPLTFEIP